MGHTLPGLTSAGVSDRDVQLRIDEMSIKCLLYADDQVNLAPLACGLQEMVNKINDSVKKRGMKVNVGGSGRKKNESRINAVEMRSLRSMYGVSRKDRCRNSDVRERCGLKEDVVTRVERVCCGGLAIWK
ncbi:hypothetical protein EVAR_40979_1 [Eumeta japonica]|uniref:Reverse transcriptase domain-containing protein n=1 Tax=Eumeta variegata TaxID=151549 RepID=A0A4C1XDI7_EUMVA|nr:hypothetical protein EVAR_40979_1 [Eumeta japonica]